MAINNFNTLSKNLRQIIKIPKANQIGTLVRVVGLACEANGLNAPLGAICEIKSFITGKVVQAEVVGFQNETIFLMPFTEATGIGPGSSVEIISNDATAKVSHKLLGRVIDCLLYTSPSPRDRTRSRMPSSA